MARVVRLLLAMTAVVTVAAAGAGCSSDAARPSGAPATTVTAVDAQPVDNVFLPVGRNLSDCVGTLERPDCGSRSKGDLQLYLTFAALMLGMSLIGWRVARGVSRRDRETTVPPHTF